MYSGDTYQPTMNSCCTSIKMHEIEYQWTITNFNLHLECSGQKKNKSILKSSSFIAGDSPTMWHLELELYGTDDINKDYIGIFTYCESYKTMPEIWASWRYIVVNNDKERLLIKETSLCEFDKTSYSKGWNKFYEKQKLLDESKYYLPDDNFTIIIQLNVMSSAYTTSLDSQISKMMKNNLSHDFSKLLINEKFTDVTFILNEYKIKAHKGIMAVRSPVFAAMFEHEMLEQNKNAVNIVDIKREIFNKMLQYIYTNEVDNLDDVAMDLLPVADKYQLDDLKAMCERVICKSITVDNAADVFIFADCHNAERLMEYTQDFIYDRIVDVLATVGYQAMEDEHPKLTAVFLRNLLLKSRKRCIEIPDDNNGAE